MKNKILVTGGSGLVGKYLKKILPEAIYVSSKDYDLTTEDGVKLMFLQNVQILSYTEINWINDSRQWYTLFGFQH